MKFSLVLATMGRTVEVSNFVAHLDAQSYRNFELIIVDQNPDDRLASILAPYQTRFIIKHLRSEKGLSRARNIGLQHVTGNIVAFPDDDSWYEPSILERIADFFLDHQEWDGVTGRPKAEEAAHAFDREGGFLDYFSVWRRAISFTIFLRTSVVRAVGDFDPLLGVGASSGFGSGEETDYLVRAVKKGCRIYYRPDLLIDHPNAPLVYDRRWLQKGYEYGRGLGHTVRKHRYPLWFLGYFLFRSICGALLSAARGDFHKAMHYCAAFRGRVSGWLA